VVSRQRKAEARRERHAEIRGLLEAVLEHNAASAELHGGWDDPTAATRNVCLMARVVRQIVPVLISAQP
jgi:hypothetical protein